MAGILEGVKVVEMGHVVAVPAAAAMLADWGAQVIKIEPLTGELIRGLRRTHGVNRVIQFDNGEMNWTFELLNRNKKGLAVDLKTEAGRDVLYRLVMHSDVKDCGKTSRDEVYNSVFCEVVLQRSQNTSL